MKRKAVQVQKVNWVDVFLLYKSYYGKEKNNKDYCNKNKAARREGDTVPTFNDKGNHIREGDTNPNFNDRGNHIWPRQLHFIVHN